MRYIIDDHEREDAMRWMSVSADMARQAMCRDARCGSVIVKDNVLIGSAYNAPAGGLESQRRCHIPKTAYHIRVTDKTCCVHAEQRAIMDAVPFPQLPPQFPKNDAEIEFVFELKR